MANGDDIFREQLQPAPGQYGYKPDARPDANARPDTTGEIPYGYKQLERAISPYVMTANNPVFADRRMGEIGTPNFSTQGMLNYPDGEMPQGDGIPSERDFPSIIHNLVMGIGRGAPSSIAMPMIQGGQNYLAAFRGFNGGGTAAFEQGYMKGAQFKAQMAREQMAEADWRLKNLLRRYGTIYQDYSDDKGHITDPEGFHQAVEAVAREYNDPTVLGMLAQGKYDLLEKHLRNLDAHGQDLRKTLQQLQIDNARLRNERLKRQEEEAAHANDAFKLPDTAPTAPGTPATSGTNDIPTAPADPNTNFDINNLPQDRQQPTAEPRAEADPDFAPPVAEPTAAPEGGGAVEPVATDISARAREAGAPIMARDDEGDDGKPSPAPTGAPAAAAAGTAAPSGVQSGETLVPAGDPRRLRVSPAQNAFHNLPGHPNNDQLLDQYALKLANKTLTQSEASSLSKEMRRIISARAAEFEGRYMEIAKQHLGRDETIRQLEEFDPYFAASLKTYVSGAAPPPMSAWQNAAYQQRVWALGKELDPDFNAGTFRERLSMYNNFAHGPQGRNINSIATLDLHAGDMITHMQELQRLNPHIWQLYIGGARLGDIPGLRPTSREAQLIAQLGVDQQTVRDEFAKAIGGTGQIHVGAQAEAERQLDFRWNKPQFVIDSLLNMRHLAHRKMETLKKQYDSVMGPMRGDLGVLIDKFAAGEDKSPGASEPNPGHAKEMLKSLPQVLPQEIPPMPTYRQVQ